MLEYLKLSYNPFTELPPEIGKLSHLRTLIIQCSRLQRLPDELGRLSSLEVLKIGGMMDCELLVDGRWVTEAMLRKPQNLEIIGRLRNLRELWLGFMQWLEELPAALVELPYLQVLSIQFTDLKTLPPEIGQLHSLTKLYLPVNELEQIPPEIEQLIRLEELDLTENRLNSLPDEIAELRRLKVLRLGNEYDFEPNNHFSPEKRRRIRKLLPNTRINYE